MTELILICRIKFNWFGLEPYMDECFSTIEKAKETLNKRFPEGKWVADNAIYDVEGKNMYVLKKITYRG